MAQAENGGKSAKSKSNTQDNYENQEEKKKRKRARYLPSINYGALKSIEGTTTSSFVALAEAVILIDGLPYKSQSLPLSTERKRDFKRLIEHFAVIEKVSSRKYYIKIVFNQEDKENIKEAHLQKIVSNLKQK